MAVQAFTLDLPSALARELARHAYARGMEPPASAETLAEELRLKLLVNEIEARPDFWISSKLCQTVLQMARRRESEIEPGQSSQPSPGA